MTDDELTEKFVRIDGLSLEVLMISWDGPHSPISEWRQAETLEPDPSQAKIDRAVKAVLSNPNFFRVCYMCEQRNPVGWMHSEDVCQGCAENHLGVVH
ncbi:MAG: hypothetical protein ACI97A_004268 [Planctomycetota bacterium]|jgi:hypothetical protein